MKAGKQSIIGCLVSLLFKVGDLAIGANFRIKGQTDEGHTDEREIADTYFKTSDKNNMGKHSQTYMYTNIVDELINTDADRTFV